MLDVGSARNQSGRRGLHPPGNDPRARTIAVPSGKERSCYVATFRFQSPCLPCWRSS